MNEEYTSTTTLTEQTVENERMHEQKNCRTLFHMTDTRSCERNCLHIFVILRL